MFLCYKKRAAALPRNLIYLFTASFNALPEMCIRDSRSCDGCEGTEENYRDSGKYDPDILEAGTLFCYHGIVGSVLLWDLLWVDRT